MKQAISTLILAAIAFTSCKRDNVSKNRFEVDEANSKVEWKGSAPDHFHVGRFDVNGSFTTSADGMVAGGDFVIPIASIEDYDLQDPEKTVLLDDLKSINFFNLPVFPQAKFHIKKSEKYTAGSDAGSIPGANILLTGDFSMIGQTHQMTFAAKVTKTSTGLLVEATFPLDRTKWGMTIYSDPNQQLYILPDVDIKLTINANKK